MQEPRTTLFLKFNTGILFKNRIQKYKCSFVLKNRVEDKSYHITITILTITTRIGSGVEAGNRSKKGGRWKPIVSNAAQYEPIEHF